MVNELSDLVPDRKICEQFKVAGMPQGETALVWIAITRGVDCDYP
jgi:hypothetical protein